MASRTIRIVWQALVGCGFWATSSVLCAGSFPAPAPNKVWFEQLTTAWHDRLGEVMNHPTLVSRGTAEVFRGSVPLYEWLLDHPDAASKLWRRLGAKCMEIIDEGNGGFRWADNQGSVLHWVAVNNRPGLRVWFAEGRIRPGLLLPEVPVTAVVVLRYGEFQERPGQPALRHQAELYFHTDSKTATLLTKMLGPTAPKLAEQCLAQLETFFSVLAAYLDRHPDKLWTLLWDTLPLEGSTLLDQLRPAPGQR